MSAFSRTVLISSLLGVFILLGCDSSTDSGSSGVTGTWMSKAPDSNLTLVFAGNAAFSGTIVYSYGTYSLSGKYTETATSISLKYASSLLASPGVTPEGVPPPSPDSVTGTILGNKMTVPIPYGPDGETVTLTKK